MTGVFHQNNPNNTFFLLLYGFVLKLPLLLFPSLIVQGNFDGPLFTAITSPIKYAGNALPWIPGFFALVIHLVIAVLLCRLANKFRLYAKANYLPGMAYLLFSSMPGIGANITSALIINLILISVLYVLFRLYNEGKALKSIFSVSVIIGIMTLVFYPAALFVLLVFVSLYLFRPFRLQEWVMVLVGLLTPFYFLFSFLFLTNDLDSFEIARVSIKLPSLRELGYEYNGYMLIGFAVLAGIYFLQNNFLRQSIHSRKCWVIIYWLLGTALVATLINFRLFPLNWLLMAVPVAMFMAMAFYHVKNKWVRLLLHWLIFIFAIAGSYHILEKININF